MARHLRHGKVYCVYCRHPIAYCDPLSSKTRTHYIHCHDELLVWERGAVRVDFARGTCLKRRPVSLERGNGVGESSPVVLVSLGAMNGMMRTRNWEKPSGELSVTNRLRSSLEC